MQRPILGTLAALALLATAASAGANEAVRVAAIRHGEVVVLTPGTPPVQLTHTGGKLLSFAFSARGDLAAATSTRTVIRSTTGATTTLVYHGGYAPPPAWSPDGSTLAVFYSDALHVYDAASRQVRTVPLPRIPLHQPYEVRWAIYGLQFGASAHELYVLGVPAHQAPADQALQRVYRIDPTAPHPALKAVKGEDLLGNVLFDHGARSPDGRWFAAPVYAHLGACREIASVAVLDLQKGRWDVQSVHVAGANDVAIPAIGSVGWADDRTLLLTAKPYTESQCSSGKQWKVPATLYRQPLGGGSLTKVAAAVNWFAQAGDVRLESRCPHWPIRVLREDPSCDGSPLVLVSGTTRTTLPLSGGPLALLPG
jgi:hypothetical protein